MARSILHPHRCVSKFVLGIAGSAAFTPRLALVLWAAGSPALSPGRLPLMSVALLSPLALALPVAALASASVRDDEPDLGSVCTSALT